MHAAREGAELFERGVELVAEAFEARGAARGITLGERRGEAELDPERDEPLLRAVVQVALDPRALLLRGR